MDNNNNVSMVNLDLWDYFRHTLTSFKQEGEHDILTFLSNERLCIPLRDQETALELQRHVGKLLTVMRTDDTESDFVNYAQYENHIHHKDNDKDLQVSASEPDIVLSNPKSFDDTNDNGTTPSKICLVNAKADTKSRPPLNRKEHNYNWRYISKTQKALPLDDTQRGE